MSIACQHGQLKRQCPLCFLDEENAELKKEIERLNTIIEQDSDFRQMVLEIEQLKAQNAALLECLKWYCDKSDDYVTSYGADPCGISNPARKCIAKLGGQNNE